MTSLKDATRWPVFPEKTHVRLLKRDHQQYSRPATILRVLPNPSGRPENQWYDVLFDDGVYGRFLGRYLERVASGETEKREGSQTSAA